MQTVKPTPLNSGFKFDPSAAPPNSTFKVPSWVRREPITPAEPTSTNGLGEPWDPLKPTFRGIDLTKPDPRIKQPQYSIQGTDPESGILFRDVIILDSTGRAPYRGDVLTKGERILSVGERVTSVDAKTKVYEGQGRTLMSGLVDAHTHFTWSNSPSLDALADLGVEEHTLFSAKSARTFLDCGYTMCLGAASAKQRLDVVIRNAINDGSLPGPRYLANGKEVAPRDGALIAGITVFADTVEEIEQVVKEHVKTGVDVIKLSMSGEEITEKLRAEDTTFDDALVAKAVEIAHQNGIRVCSHARSDQAILQCLQYGVDIIYHGSFISDSTMDALEAQKDRVFVAPGINWLVATLNDAAAYGYPLEKAEAVGYVRELEIAIAGLKEMKKRGIRILPGGDYGFAWCPHGTYRDLEHFVNLLNFSPMDAILSATALGGEILLRPEELGKVQPGYYADLILLNGSPLDNISLLSNRDNLDVIVINGRIHKDTKQTVL